MGRAVEQVAEDVPHHPIAIDHVGDPAGQEPQGLGNPEGLAQGIAAVNQQWIGKLMTGGEPAVAAGVIAADTPHLGAKGFERGVVVAERTGLGGAAGSVVLGVEEQHQGLALKLIAAALHAALIGEGNQGGPLSQFDGVGQTGSIRCDTSLETPGLAPPPCTAGIMGRSEQAGMELEPGSGEERNRWQQTSLLSLVAPAQLCDGTAEKAVEATDGAATPSTPAQQPLPPARLLILDTETTGLDPLKHRCIEVGAVLFDVPQRAVLSQISFLLPCQTNEAETVNGIAAAVTRLSQPWPEALAYFQTLVAASDLILAHNAGFDRQWFGHGPLPAIEKPWLCSMEDLRWPPDRNLRANPSVRDLALAYGVPVWAAHRALTDCIYLAQVLERCDDLEGLLCAGLEPRQLYRARLPYEERHRARQAGFRWNDPVPKAWSRRLSAREAAAIGFPVSLEQLSA